MRALYLCYLALDDPLVETQVVAYLEGLAGRGHRIHLLTWETRRIKRKERRRIQAALRRRGIEWHHLRYHKRPSLPATAFDAACGVVVGLYLTLRYRLAIVHCRSHVPALAGTVLKRLSGAALIFDIRGLLAEEYVDSGNWRPGSLPVRITKRIERAAIDASDATVTLTHRVAHDLFGPAPWKSHWVIPCCADVERIAAQESRRDELRQELGITDRTVLVYVGKLGGWYLDREMVRFFAVVRQVMGPAHFLVLTQADVRSMIDEMSLLGIPRADFTMLRVPPAEVGAYLAAADLAVSLIVRAPSKASSSPTKVGEYLAAGLPIVLSAGIGDLDDLIRRNRLGVLLEQFDGSALMRAASDIEALRHDGELALRCRSTARRELSLPNVGVSRYDDLYCSLARRAA